jgi:hypothetical protein
MMKRFSVLLTVLAVVLLLGFAQIAAGQGTRVKGLIVTGLPGEIIVKIERQAFSPVSPISPLPPPTLAPTVTLVPLPTATPTVGPTRPPRPTPRVIWTNTP